MVHYIAERFRTGLREIQELYPRLASSASARTASSWAWSSIIPKGAKLGHAHLYENGVWAIFSTLDPRVLQFKPGILIGPDLVDEMLDRTAVRDRARPRRGTRRARRDRSRAGA